MEPLGVEGGVSRGMASFRAHEESYHACSRTINNHINQVTQRGTTAVTDGVKGDLADAEIFIKGMDIEVRSMKGSERRQCQSRANQCRADLKALKRALNQAVERAQAEELRKGKWGGGDEGLTHNTWSSGPGFSGQDNSQGFDTAQASLNRGRMSLLDSQRVLEETEGIGQRVTGDLEAQRESLLRSQGNVQETGGMVERARGELRALSGKELRHRLCLYLIISALSCAILYLLYLKIRKLLT
ncbi:unnamed protein product [Discosporangium mesarthrocarpum]